MAVQIKKKVAMPKQKTYEDFSRIKDMSPEQRLTIDSMLLEGKPIAKVSETIQKGWGMFQDISQATLTKYLQRYKWQVIDRPLPSQVPSIRKNVNELLERFQYAVNEIEPLVELTDLIAIQKQRIHKLLEAEKKLPSIVLQSVRAELKLLAELIQQYTALSFDLGHLKRVPNVSKISINGGVISVESTAKDKLQEDLQKQQGLATAANELLTLLNSIPDDNAKQT